MSIIYTIYKNRNCRNISYEKSIFTKYGLPPFVVDKFKTSQLYQQPYKVIFN